MFDTLLVLHEVWLRLIKDGLVKNTDSEAFARLGSFCIDKRFEPTYETALMVLFPSNEVSGNNYLDSSY